MRRGIATAHAPATMVVMVLPPAGILPIDLDWDAVDQLSRSYLLGVPEIDHQHRMLFAWCVALRRSPELQVVEGLLAYAARHFADEENWAYIRGIDFARHQQLHDDIIAQLEALYAGDASVDAAALASNWLVRHIDVEDRGLIAAQRSTRHG